MDGDERGVWCPIPDKELEDIKGRVKVRTQSDIYEKSREVLVSICEALHGNEFLVTSDHGYISTETHFLPLSRRVRGAMQAIFSASRYAEAGTRADELIGAGYVVQHEGYYLVGNRYAWATRGKYPGQDRPSDAARRDQPAGVPGTGAADRVLAGVGVKPWPSM